MHTFFLCEYIACPECPECQTSKPVGYIVGIIILTLLVGCCGCPCACYGTYTYCCKGQYEKLGDNAPKEVIRNGHHLGEDSKLKVIIKNTENLIPFN